MPKRITPTWPVEVGNINFKRFLSETLSLTRVLNREGWSLRGHVRGRCSKWPQGLVNTSGGRCGFWRQVTQTIRGLIVQ